MYTSGSPSSVFQRSLPTVRASWAGLDLIGPIRFVCAQRVSVRSFERRSPAPAA